MLVNFLLIAVSVLTVGRRNPALARAITVVPDRRIRTLVAALGVVVLAAFLAVHTWKDLTGPAAAWYFRSTPVWAIVMALGSLVYRIEVGKLRRAGIDLHDRFAALPPE
jgi:basic amino acid/polyamine antiporter, APA family